MRFPWVRQSRLRSEKRLNRQLLKEMATWVSRASDAESKIAGAEAARDEIRSMLERSERERTDLQLKMLQLGFGVNPFLEEVPAPQTAPVAESAEAAEMSFAMPTDASSPTEVRDAFAREAVQIYGTGNLRAIRNHIERRQAEFYQFRSAPPPIASPAELARARSVTADLQAAIEEGRAAAARGE